MDLFNNSRGAEIGINNPGLTEIELANLICNYLNSGDMKIVKNPRTQSAKLISSNGCTCK